jgi:YHYH protein
MNLSFIKARHLATLALLLGGAFATAADPLLDSWLTDYTGRYARIYTNAATQAAGTTVTVWSNGSQTQAQPAYVGVQEIYSSADWVYLRTTGLGSHIMGPWSVGFPNLPVNQHVLYRLPRKPSATATKTLTGLGAIGYFVDGVAMFDSRDANYWNGTTETQGTGNWNRDAYVNEGPTFDPAYAHQENTGTYHYHANPVALRYLLGDHVNYDAGTKTYSESTNPPTRHSPILGWVRDGYPVYGPYGYAVATNAASGVRRMISGFVLRNGQQGTQNLTAIGRAGIPAWAQRLYNVTSNAVAGPAVSATYPLGRYMEDNDFLGDLGRVQGTDFDLDEYNGRFCVTPEYPNGIYAYFVSIAADGTPTFPYNIGRAFYGNPTGAAVTTLSETVTTNYVGGPNSALVLE